MNRLPPYKIPDTEQHRGHTVSTETGECVKDCHACEVKSLNKMVIGAIMVGIVVTLAIAKWCACP